LDSNRFVVRTLKLENFRCFKNVELGPFDSHFNLLVGANGAGKSSVLLALANLFRPLARGQLAGGSTVGERDVRINEVGKHEIMQPFVQLAPWEMTSDFNWKDIPLVAKDKFERGNLSQKSADLLWLTPKRGISSAISNLGYDPSDWPRLLALYTTDRRFQNSSVVKQDQEDSTDTSLHPAFANWLNAGISADAFRDWMRQETLIALQDGQYTSSALDGNTGKSYPAYVPISKLKIVQEAIRNAVEDATSVEYVERRKDIVVQFGDGAAHEFSKMSDGQRALIGLVGDIARRACSLYDLAYGFDVLKKTSGVVLIDELDLHLHPRWQRRVVDDLKRIFPSIQFFATTHSPQIIGEARPEEIILLTESGQKRPSQSFGMDSNWVLECVMEAEGRDAKVAKEIRSLFDAIEGSRFEEARGMIAALRRDIGDAPDITGAESYLWNLEHSADEAAE
jgi:predicted ATP-binding protein involved in virulence